MLQTHLKMALRILRKRKAYTFINLTGLVIGVTVFFLITLWVKDELSYDRFIPNTERTFRLESQTLAPDKTTMHLAEVGWPVGKTLQQNYPEVEKVTYLRMWSPLLKYKDNYIYEYALAADENFLSVLGYELARGNPQTALQEPFSLVISQEMEEKYFGKGNGMGKTLMISDTLPHRVTGVFKELPRRSHLKFDMVRSMSTICALYPKDCEYEYASGWFDLNVNTYVLLKPNVNAQTFEAKIKNLVSKYGQKAVQETGFNATLQLRPVRDIYLYSGKPTAGGDIGNIRTVYLFVTIGVFILLLACLNFINLSTARAVERAKEVGIKKVLGSRQTQLVRQFLTEAAVLCTGAALLSLVMTTVALPLFNQFTGKSFSVQDLLSTDNLLLLTVILLVMIPLTGFYPAYVLSSYQPITVLKGSFARSTKGILLRKSLVVVQFGVSVCLIISTLVVWQQLRFMQKQSLGFDKDKVIIVDAGEVPWRIRQQQAQVFKKELNNQSLITSVTAATAVPGRSGWSGQFAYGEGSSQTKGILVEHIPVDYDYMKTMGLHLVAGRDFRPDSKADSVQSYLINETAARAFGWETPAQAIGKKLAASGMNGQVIGVLKDYHQHGLQETIRPVVMNVAPYINVFALRYKGNNTAEAVSQLKNTWQNLFPGYPLDYRFLDDDFQQQYAKEQKLTRAFTTAAVLAIVIACLGLFGLATYAVESRTKEIGIRKVLGASVSQITALLSKDFIRLVLLAFVIATPVAWYVMNQWLQDFAYRIAIAWWIFALAGILALFIALITVSFQAIKAAVANPVKSLRSE